MEKITKIKDSEIRKEQLLSEGNFLHYCNDANNRVVTMTGKLHKWIEADFLRAMENDGFLKPLLIVEQPVRQNDGSTKEQPIHYYSPFQIYIVLQLSHNIVDEQGRLQSPDSIKWQNQQKTRYISWGSGGGMSFNLELQAKTEKNPFGGPTQLALCRYLHDFLLMLHSFDIAERSSREWKDERGRYFTGSPNFQFNFDRLKADKLKLLDQFDVSVDKLEILRTNIGQTALIIDPLEKWYPFLQRLPQWRKDELKGDALLAQDLYGLCEIIADILEIVSGVRPQGLLEKLRSDFPLPDIKRNEHARGTDIEAIRLAASKLKTWMTDEKNSKFVNEISNADVMDGYHKRLEQIKKQLADYEKRYKKYGAGRSVNSGGFLHTGIKNTGTITIDELDPQAKRMAQQFMEQSKAQGAVDEPAELQQEIRVVIRWRLDDIQRDLSQLIHDMCQPLDSRRWQLDAEKQRGQQSMWWGEYARSGEAPTDPAQSRAYYIKKFQPKKIAEYDEKIKPLVDVSLTLERFMHLARLVLCANCRKNTVLLHQTHNDQRVSFEAICDECIKNVPNLQHIKGGEWNCAYCGEVIYKFAYSNIISDVLKNTSNSTIRLDYGRVTIRARCPNKDCNEWNEDYIDYGWVQ